jgi:hypothetical protein
MKIHRDIPRDSIKISYISISRFIELLIYQFIAVSYPFIDRLDCSEPKNKKFIF